MKRRIIVAALVLLAVTRVASFADGPTPYPDPQDEGAWPGSGPIRIFPYMADNRQSFWQQRAQAQGAVVLVGDSLIQNYKAGVAFPNLHVANRGIGGDVTRGLLFRLKEDVIDLNPQAVIIEIGTNDLSCQTNPYLAVENIGEMVFQLREANDKLPIVLMVVPPRAVADASIKEGALETLNEGIHKLAEGREGIEVVDVFTPLAGPDGKPDPAYFQANMLNLNEAGYKKWTEALAPALEKLGVK